MTVRGFHRGNPMSFDGEDWRYDRDGVLVSSDPDRACGTCGIENTVDGHDGCIGNLPCVLNACCGHGRQGEAYIQFSDGKDVRGKEALFEIERLKR